MSLFATQISPARNAASTASNTEGSANLDLTQSRLTTSSSLAKASLTDLGLSRQDLRQTLSNSVAIDQIETIVDSMRQSGNQQGLHLLKQLLSKPDALNSLDQNSRGSQSLLTHLSELATANVPNSLTQTKTEVINSLLKHLTNPDSIHQDGTATCTMTVAQTELAKYQPAEYARITTELFTKGSTMLADGATKLTRYSGFATRSDTSNDRIHGHRDRLELMIQDALMDKGAELEGGAYNPITDTIIRANGIQERGLHKPAYQFLLNATMNRNTEIYSVEAGASAKSISQQVFRNLDLSSSADYQNLSRPVPVEISLQDAGMHALHMVMVTGVVNINGEQYVKFYNPWGGIKTAADGSSQIHSYNAENRSKIGNSWQACETTTGSPDAGKFELIKMSEFNQIISCAIVDTGQPASASTLSADNVLKQVNALDLEGTFSRDSNGVYQIQVSTLTTNLSTTRNSALQSLKTGVDLIKPLTLEEMTARLTSADENKAVLDRYHQLEREFYQRSQDTKRNNSGFVELADLQSEFERQKGRIEDPIQSLYFNKPSNPSLN